MIRVAGNGQIIRKIPAQTGADVFLNAIGGVGHIGNGLLRIDIKADASGIGGFSFQIQVQKRRGRGQVYGIVKKINAGVNAGGIKVHRLAGLDRVVQNTVDDLGAGCQRNALKLNGIVPGICIVIETAVAVAAAPEFAIAIRRHPARIGFAGRCAIPLVASIHCCVVRESIHGGNPAFIR